MRIPTSYPYSRRPLVSRGNRKKQMGQNEKSAQVVLSVHGLSLNAGMVYGNPTQTFFFTFKIPNLPAWCWSRLVLIYISDGFQQAFTLGNLTKLNVELPVREIPSCFLDIIWRANPFPRAPAAPSPQKKTPSRSEQLPLQRYIHYSLRSSTAESRRELECVFVVLECILRPGLLRGL